MGASSYLRLLRLAPTVAALAAGAGRGAQQAVTAAADAATAASGGEGAWGVSAHLAHRQLIEEGGNGLSSGMVAGYIIISIVLVAVSGLMVRARCPSAATAAVAFGHRVRMARCRH